MAISVSNISPIPGNVIGYTYAEDATPIIPGDLTGGVGEIAVQAPDFPDAILLYSGDFTLTDTERGVVAGVVTGAGVTDGVLSIQAQSPLRLFNIYTTINPFVGDFEGAFNYWCSVAGVTNTVVMDSTIAERAVVYPGWIGNMWDMLKHALTAESLEIAVNADNEVVVRELRENSLNTVDETTRTEQVSTGNSSKYIEMVYYNHQYAAQGEVYPVPGEQAAIYQVDAGQTIEVDIPLKAWMMSVNQPECIEFVEADAGFYENTDGVYAVAGNDNLPVPPDMWEDYGGFLRVELTDDPSVIRAVIRGADYEPYAPYRIAMTSGNYYNSLHITGETVRYSAKSIRFPTGADPLLTAEEIGITVENPFIRTRGQAVSLGGHVATQYSGLTHTLNAESASLDLQFGEIAGARAEGNNTKFRVGSVTTGPATASISGLSDVTLGDYADAWGPSATLADEAAAWAGKTLRDQYLMPLRGA